jgi:uncharacterized protein YecE (DUF72 family)
LRSQDFNPPNLAVEFRNNNWFKEDSIEDTFNLLEEYKLTYCAVVEPLVPPILRIPSESLFYIRFHGFGSKPWFNYNFSESELQDWAEKLKPILNRINHKNPPESKAVLYFNNHFSGYAVKNALYMAKILDIPVKNNTKNLTKPINILTKSQHSIDDFMRK